MQQFNIVTKEDFNMMEIDQYSSINKTIKCKICGRSKRVTIHFKKTQDGQLEIALNNVWNNYVPNTVFNVNGSQLFVTHTIGKSTKKYSTKIISRSFYVKYKNIGFSNTVDTQMVTTVDSICENCIVGLDSVLSNVESQTCDYFIISESDHVGEVSFELLKIGDIEPDYMLLEKKYNHRSVNYDESLVEQDVKNVEIDHQQTLQDSVMNLLYNRRRVIDKIEQVFLIKDELYLRLRNTEVLPYSDVVSGWNFFNSSINVPAGKYRLFTNHVYNSNNKILENGCYNPLCLLKIYDDQNIYQIMELNTGDILPGQIYEDISKYLIPIGYSGEEYKKDYFYRFCNITNIEYNFFYSYDKPVYLNQDALNNLRETEISIDTIKEIINGDGFRIKNYIYKDCTMKIVLNNNIEFEIDLFDTYVSEYDVYNEWLSELEVALTTLKFKNIWGFMEMF